MVVICDDVLNMSSGEMVDKGSERWWSYNTPYDIVHRAEIIAIEGKQSPRVADIDRYVAYINDEMPSEFIAVTQINSKTDRAYQNPDYVGTLVYRPNDKGKYKYHASITMTGRFFGNKVAIIEDQVVLINSYENIGVSANEYIKLERVDVLDAPYELAPLKIMNFKQGVLQRLLLLQKNTNRAIY